MNTKLNSNAGSGCSSHVLLASSIARKAHAGQFRRDGITPYISHPEAVAKSLEGEHPDVIAAAWLHDVLEDTDVTISELKHAGIPVHVIDAVELLTRDDGQPYEDYLHWIAQDEIARKGYSILGAVNGSVAYDMLESEIERANDGQLFRQIVESHPLWHHLVDEYKRRGLAFPYYRI